MSEKTTHPFVEEIAEETRNGNIDRRDFFKYAMVMGLSVSAAGKLVGVRTAQAGIDQTEIVAKKNWAALRSESPFEIKNLLIQEAKKASPDWINAWSRQSKLFEYNGAKRIGPADPVCS